MLLSGTSVALYFAFCEFVFQPTPPYLCSHGHQCKPHCSAPTHAAAPSHAQGQLACTYSFVTQVHRTSHRHGHSHGIILAEHAAAHRAQPSCVRRTATLRATCLRWRWAWWVCRTHRCRCTGCSARRRGSAGRCGTGATTRL